MEKDDPLVSTFKVGETIDTVERRLIEKTLEACKGSKREASLILGVSFKTIYNKLKRYKQEATQA